jgi:EAL domain-containing protein (putative c-di-GMP-specific phosphodiesterase class I)
VHQVKIDRAFVALVEGGPEDAALVRAVIRLARSLRREAVAEGIETAGQARALRAFGCELGQGHWLCPPLPADALGSLLAAGRLPARPVERRAVTPPP